MSDVVIIGSGIVGVSCAYYAARAGLAVTVLERDSVASGTTSRGEGNILVSDKAPGPELDLAIFSRRLWIQLGEQLGAENLELDEKGGLVVAHTAQALHQLEKFAEDQLGRSVEADLVPSDRLHDYEPYLSPELAGGVFYPHDLQVQPVLAAAAMMGAAETHGARLVRGAKLTGVERDSQGAIQAVRSTQGRHPARAVINAAGTWGAQVSEVLGGPIPVLPRRGFVLVTEPLPPVIHRKVYSADYVSNVASSDASLETSAVVEGTRGGTVLIGASRERVGFDESLSVEVVRRLAGQAISLFPFLSDVFLMRAYRGFRPYCPDHLPVIGADSRVPGLFHACGHEGAGIGLAPATGFLLSQMLSGATPDMSMGSFSPDRFEQVTV